MTVEIERRFLLADDSWREAASEPLVLQQVFVLLPELVLEELY